ncbi:MAG: acyl carrier protein [Opitutales bacterium]
MNDDAFISQFADSIEGLEAAGLTLDTRLADIPQWDSLAILTTIAMADADFEATVSGQELNQCATIGDIKALIERKQG